MIYTNLCVHNESSILLKPRNLKTLKTKWFHGILSPPSRKFYILIMLQVLTFCINVVIKNHNIQKLKSKKRVSTTGLRHNTNLSKLFLKQVPLGSDKTISRHKNHAHSSPIMHLEPVQPTSQPDIMGQLPSRMLQGLESLQLPHVWLQFSPHHPGMQSERVGFIIIFIKQYSNGQFHRCQSWSFITVHGQYSSNG